MNSRTGRTERVYVDLEAVYPNPDDSSEEYSFEELIARQRGWLNADWDPEPQVERADVSENIEQTVESHENLGDREASKTTLQELNLAEDQQSAPENASYAKFNSQENTQELRRNRARKMKVKEVKAEAQTSKIMCYSDIVTKY